ncbi:MAG: DUF3096 domain-containing protein [Candidatus Woesearchaeota archaeon]
MEIGLFISPVITIITGILILIFPNSLRFLVGGYLILIGIVNLLF